MKMQLQMQLWMQIQKIFVPLHPTNVSPYCKNRQNLLKGIRGTDGSSH